MQWTTPHFSVLKLIWELREKRRKRSHMARQPDGMEEEIKKGSWTSEEDRILSSYIQEIGPGNWTSVPISAGLNRSAKSCRHRWSNYLRPGINRGTYTAEEDRRIIQLQAVLGNKWAAIARYLPGRSDNDVKNRWNTHLKKTLDGPRAPNQISDSSKNLWERRLHANVQLASKALSDALSLSSQDPISEYDISLPSGCTLPPTASGIGSPLSLATSPQLSSGIMSLKPPLDWNQNASQQELINPADDHQFRSQVVAQITRASNHSTTEPYIFNCENVALWLQGWDKEISKSTLNNISARHQRLPSAAVAVPAAPTLNCRQHEDSMSSFEAASSFPSGQNKDDRLPPLNMSIPYDHQSSWSFF